MNRDSNYFQIIHSNGVGFKMKDLQLEDLKIDIEFSAKNLRYVIIEFMNNLCYTIELSIN